MTISPERLDEFVRLCEQYFGFTPEEDEALEMANKLLEMVMHTLPKSGN